MDLQRMVASTASPPLLEMRGICKAFPGVRALDNVGLTLHEGEVLALLGENGAGKSTLIKMLGGAHRPDSGAIHVDGREVSLPDPAAANATGIGVIFQEFNLVPELTASENIFLGREHRIGFVRRRQERRRASELFAQMSVDIPLDIPCRELSVAQQQTVEIAKALAQDVRLIVMDEPSAALTPKEVQRLFAMIRDLKSKGIGIIYISHRLEEVFEIADRITVLRDGRQVGNAKTTEIDRHRLIELMVGREIEDEFPKEPHELGTVMLAVQDLSRGQRVRDISFSVRRGEIVGITGLVGSGRTELLRVIFGADRADNGKVTLDGRALTIRDPRDSIRAGICLLTEDRKSQGLVLGLNVRENFGLPNLAKFSSFGFVDAQKEYHEFAGFVDRLQIKTPNQEQLAKHLSGGNQQKVVLAKWLAQNASVIMFDEPTRGIDVGAKYEIYLLMNELARQGKAIIMVSSELPEILGMSDRILIMHQGKIAGEVKDVDAATQEELMELAVG